MGFFVCLIRKVLLLRCYKDILLSRVLVCHIIEIKFPFERRGHAERHNYLQTYSLHLQNTHRESKQINFNIKT